MSRVTLGPPKIEGRIWPRTRVEDGGRYLVIPPKGAFQHSRVSRKPGAVHGTPAFWHASFQERRNEWIRRPLRWKTSRIILAWARSTRQLLPSLEDDAECRSDRKSPAFLILRRPRLEPPKASVPVDLRPCEGKHVRPSPAGSGGEPDAIRDVTHRRDRASALAWRWGRLPPGRSQISACGRACRGPALTRRRRERAPRGCASIQRTLPSAPRLSILSA
jgi:hypothetical protein